LSLAAVEALIFRARRALAEELELVDRVPIVRPRRRLGILGLPGLAKAASFGFSFGRVGFACLVGCAVLGTVPVGDSSASDEPAVAKARTPQVVTSYERPSVERAHPAPAKEKKHKGSQGSGTAHHHQARPPRGESDNPSDGGGSLLPVELPPVELPPVELPPVEVPEPLPSLEVPPPPPLPEVPDLPPVPPLTS
jgi:hypothetical protein